MKNIIVGIGEILWDIFPDTEVLGGAPANFAFHAGQLGEESYIVSAIGKDELGDVTLNTLRHKEAKYLIERLNYPTGKVTVELNEAGIPSYIIHEGVAWDHIIFTEKMKELAQQTDAVCFGTLAQRHTISRKAIMHFLEHMPPESMKMFDINLRQDFYSNEIIEQSLQVATALKMNEEELAIVAEMVGLPDRSDTVICNELRKKYNLNFVILTKGSQGSSIYSTEGESHLPTKRVIVTDTVGAGDAFTAAFVTAYLHGYELQKAHHLAVEISAYVCTQQGGMAPLPEEFRLKL